MPAARRRVPLLLRVLLLLGAILLPPAALIAAVATPVLAFRHRRRGAEAPPGAFFFPALAAGFVLMLVFAGTVVVIEIRMGATLGVPHALGASIVAVLGAALVLRGMTACTWQQAALDAGLSVLPAFWLWAGFLAIDYFFGSAPALRVPLWQWLTGSGVVAALLCLPAGALYGLAVRLTGHRPFWESAGTAARAVFLAAAVMAEVYYLFEPGGVWLAAVVGLPSQGSGALGGGVGFLLLQAPGLLFCWLALGWTADPAAPGPRLLESLGLLVLGNTLFFGGILMLAVASPDLLVAVVGILSYAVPLLGIGLLVYLRGRRAISEGNRPLSDNYGTAAFEGMQITPPQPDWLHRGIFLGKSSHPDANAVPLDQQPGIPICTTPENHTLIVARTRTGKGTRVIIPTLLRYAGSMVVIDPKGENAAVTARPRLFAKVTDKVHVINPWGELAKAYAQAGIPQDTFNPLDMLDRGDPNAVAIAQGLAAAVCPSSPGDKDSFWQGSAANVLAAVLLWITDQPGETKTLARAREIVSLSRKDFTDRFLVPMAASSAFGGAIRELISPYLDLADDTYSGIIANLSENTKFLSDPQVKAATATSTFALTDLIHERRTVYLVIPPDRIDTQRTWLRLMLAAVSQTYRRAARNSSAGLSHRCLILIDEFPALGKITDMPGDLATMAGYGVDYALVVQGIDQLRDLYGKAAGTILSNCAYKWFCNVNDLESAKYLSETLGKKTVQTVGRSEREGQDGESLNYGETARLLLAPDEILNLGRETAIVTHPGGNPHYLRPIDYWNLQAAFPQLQARYSHTYWDPPLVYDPNPYHARKQQGAGQQQGAKQEQGNGQDKDAGQQQRRKAEAPANGRMSRAEALSVLGLRDDASEADIRAAYKRLIQKLHPDTGGSDWIARNLNAARDTLLPKKARR